LYYTDIGLASGLFGNHHADDRNINGIIAENFVYSLLYLRDAYHKLGIDRPIFGTYGNKEINFLVPSKITKKKFAIDVTTGSSSSESAQAMLNDGLVDYVLYARENSHGGRTEGKTMTVPIYLLGRFDFDKIY
jgi:hypothetical protein